MTAPARRSATYQDVLDAPEHQVAELIDGDLYLQPRPAKPHTNVASVLAMLLGPPFHLGWGGPGGWWILDEPELHLNGDVLVPDLAGWRRDAVPAFDLTEAYYSEVPAWVCEVLSPATMGLDVRDRSNERLRGPSARGHARPSSPMPRIDSSCRPQPRTEILADTLATSVLDICDPVKKLPKYGAAGVQHAWLLDPLARTLEVFAWSGGRWSLASTHEGDEECRAEPFVDVPLTLGDLWLPAG